MIKFFSYLFQSLSRAKSAGQRMSPTPLAKIRRKIESCIICMLIFANGTQKSASQALLASLV